MHQAAIFEIWNLIEILDKAETENDKEEMFKAIECFRYKYNKIGHSSRSSSIQRSKITKEVSGNVKQF